MRRLLLLRHSKAVPSDGRDDFERPLADRGLDDARTIGSSISRNGMAPDLVVYSGARRTQETTELAVARWSPRPELRKENAIYDAPRGRLFALIQGLPDIAGSAMFVGHNPGIADLANYLAGHGDEHVRLRLAAKFPTSGLAVIDLPIRAWSEVAAHNGELVAFLTPSLV